VVDQGEPRLKDPDSPAPSEQRAAIAWRARSVLAYLPRSDAGLSASPDALRDLKRRAEADPDLQELITAASTPSPLRPELTRPLVDAWAMTSIDAHTGRPEVAPWLRGWIDEEEPQTAIVWRASLPIRSEEPAAIEEIETFFEAAPPHASEILETETWRVVEWLMERARRTSGVSSADRLPRDRIVTIALTSSRQIIRARDGRPLTLTLSDLAPTKEQTARKAQQLERTLAGATIIVDALMGGLDPSGMLDASSDVIPLTADTPGSAWPQSEDTGRPIVGFILHPDQPVDNVIIEASDIVIFATRRSEDGQVQRAHLIETWTTEESRAAASRAQLLDEHESWAAEEADRIARRLGLEKDIAHALVAAARLHDEGKRAQRWQRSFNAPSNGIYAKTKGPLNTVHLDGYRHEFGSIPHTAASPLVTALADPDLRDLVLHLVAAHHGFARPSITSRGCEDGPPSALQVRAQQVALRFVRLQKQWGPWGLAWLEALLRAADQRASRRNDMQAGARHG
jgi:CRISPR-associated endonuclease/helicase Cas3